MLAVSVCVTYLGSALLDVVLDLRRQTHQLQDIYVIELLIRYLKEEAIHQLYIT